MARMAVSLWLARAALPADGSVLQSHPCAAFHPLPKFSPALMIPGEPADKENGE